MKKIDYYSDKITENCVWKNKDNNLVFNTEKIEYLIASYGVACVLDSKIFKEAIEICESFDK